MTARRAGSGRPRRPPMVRSGPTRVGPAVTPRRGPSPTWHARVPSRRAAAGRGRPAPSTAFHRSTVFRSGRRRGRQRRSSPEADRALEDSDARDDEHHAGAARRSSGCSAASTARWPRSSTRSPARTASGGANGRSSSAGLVEAMAEIAVSESVIDFPMGTAFWDSFTVEQCRRVVGALASMGYQYDGRDGWVDSRVPGLPRPHQGPRRRRHRSAADSRLAEPVGHRGAVRRRPARARGAPRRRRSGLHRRRHAGARRRAGGRARGPVAGVGVGATGPARPSSASRSTSASPSR